MNTKENEMITPENFKEVKEYLKENYKCSHMGSSLKHGIATRHFESIEGFQTIMYVGTFEGERSHSVRVYLSVEAKGKRDSSRDKVEIYRTIFTLDELKEMESKVTELNEFVLKLGLWK